MPQEINGDIPCLLVGLEKKDATPTATPEVNYFEMATPQLNTSSQRCRGMLTWKVLKKKP